MVLAILFLFFVGIAKSQVPPEALIRLQVAYGGQLDETVVYLHQFATDTCDLETYDSPKLMGSGTGVPNVFSWTTCFGGTNIRLSANGLAWPFGQCISVPVGMRPDETGTYTFSIPEIYGFAESNIFVSLVDLSIPDTFLFQTTGQQYAFSAVVGEPLSGRFYLEFCPDSPVGERIMTNSNSKCNRELTRETFELFDKSSLLQISSLDGKILLNQSISDYQSLQSYLKYYNKPLIVSILENNIPCRFKLFSMD